MVSASDSAKLVEKFKAGLETYPANSLGFNSLICETFIVAAESTTEAEQAFFKYRFLEIYRSNGFINCLGASQMLERIWSGPADQKWAYVLGDCGVFAM